MVSIVSNLAENFLAQVLVASRVENQKLENYLYKKLPAHRFVDVCTYLFKHPGKLFRSHLIEKLADDLKINKDIIPLCAFVEVHHTYTLIHDDLPAMDDDDMRRGIKSTHLQYDEASAILAGDALLNASYSFLADMHDPSDSQKLLRLSSWCCGAKGLISGQYFDLEQRQKSFEEILRIHELKTSRLFQFCSLGCFILCDDKKHKTKDFMRLGSLIGLIFQILDDYQDRNETGAEFNNLFSIDHKRAKTLLMTLYTRFKNLTKKYQLEKTSEFIASYSKSQIDQI